MYQTSPVLPLDSPIVITLLNTYPFSMTLLSVSAKVHDHMVKSFNMMDQGKLLVATYSQRAAHKEHADILRHLR